MFLFILSRKRPNYLFVYVQGYGERTVRELVHEISGPIDWVYDPDRVIGKVDLCRRRLFANEPMRGIFESDGVDEGPLDARVRLGDDVGEAGLVLNRLLLVKGVVDYL